MGKRQLIVQSTLHILTYDIKSVLKEMLTKMKINLKNPFYYEILIIIANGSTI